MVRLGTVLLNDGAVFAGRLAPFRLPEAAPSPLTVLRSTPAALKQRSLGGDTQ